METQTLERAEHDLEEKVEDKNVNFSDALVEFKTYAREQGRRAYKTKGINKFMQTRPEQALALVQQYDTQHPNGPSLWYKINHGKKSLNNAQKVREIVEEKRLAGYGRIRKFVKKSPSLYTTLITLGSILATNYALDFPISQNRGNITQIIKAIKETENPRGTEKLDKLIESDILKTNSESCGYLIRDKKGNTSFERTHTLNELLPEKLLPEKLRDYLDRHHIRIPLSQIPFYLSGDEILTTWHIHCACEGISKSDENANNNEIVIVDGLIPWRYIITKDGNIMIPFGKEIKQTNNINDELKLLLGFSMIPISIRCDPNQNVSRFHNDNQTKREYFNYFTNFLDSNETNPNNE